MTTEPPLTGVTVLDLTRVLSGPYCTMLLADMGARVIKIEQPGSGDDTRAWGPPFLGVESAYFLSVNRNKESLTLDLKSPAARPVLDRLLARPTSRRELQARRDGAAWARTTRRVSGTSAARLLLDLRVRTDRPAARRSGLRRGDAGGRGLMSITGEADGPPFRLGVAISDIVTGMFAFQGIAMALLARTRTGRGQLVDVGDARRDRGVAHVSVRQLLGDGRVAARAWATGTRRSCPTRPSPPATATSVLAVGNDALWRALLPGLRAGGARRRSALRHEPAARARLRRSASRRLPGACGPAPGRVDCCVDGGGRPVRSRAGCRRSPRRPAARRARDGRGRRARDARHRFRCSACPIKLSETPGAIRTAPPTLGEHTEAILTGDLGFTPDEMGAMRGTGVV